jgi:DNA invertase Pin-like site-specific DNA recombinase
MIDEQLAHENERRARQGRPPRPYNPTFLEKVTKKHIAAWKAEADFLKAIDDAIAAGVPLRDIESRTGISRTSLSRGLSPRWSKYGDEDAALGLHDR